MRTTFGWVCASFILVAGAACGGESPAASDGTFPPAAADTAQAAATATPVIAGTVIEVELLNQTISPNPLEVSAGESVTLSIRNQAQGITHRMWLYDRNPYTNEGAIVVGETGDMAPSTQQFITFTADRPEYALVCVIHDWLGMVSFIVPAAVTPEGGEG